VLQKEAVPEDVTTTAEWGDTDVQLSAMSGKS
jgi:hypothetical protein